MSWAPVDTVTTTEGKVDITLIRKHMPDVTFSGTLHGGTQRHFLLVLRSSMRKSIWPSGSFSMMIT